MSYIIVDLRREHRVIISSLLRAKELALKSQEGYEVLRDAWQELQRHLGREDDMLYGRLREAAMDDPGLSGLLDRFQAEAASVTAAAAEFFQRVERDSEAVDLAREFGMFVSILRDRILREEEILFPEYEKRFGA